MAGYGKKCFSILFFSIILVSIQCLETIEPSKNCSEQCRKSYAPHTSITNGEPESCARGCRFYIIAKYVNAKDEATGSYLPSCLESCKEAYPPSTDKRGVPCSDGCKFQDAEEKPQTEEAPKETDSDANSEGEEAEKGEANQSLMARLQNATPVLQIRKVMAQVVGGFHILRTQVMTYFLQKDNTLIAVESPPEIMVNVVPEGEGGVHSSEDLLNRYGNQQEQGSDDQMQRESPFADFHHPSETVTKVSLRDRRYAYLIHLLLLLAGVSAGLLAISYCIALARHQQRRTLKAANINMALQQEPLKLVRPEDLTKLSLMEEEEAPPLPNKHDLALSHAQV